MSHATTPTSGKRRFTRRRFMNLCWGSLAATLATYAYGSHIEAHRLVVEHVAIPIPGLAPHLHGTRLVQLSDFHAGRASASLIERSLQLALDLSPDFLLLTGDQVDSSISDIEPLCHLLRGVTSKVPTLACTGNHDFAPAAPNFADTVCNALTRSGVRMLRNALYQPAPGRPGPGELCFAGIEDLWRGSPQPAILRSAPPDASIIVLAHNPDAYESLAPYRWHLTLSGHTHGGQVILPFLGPPSVPIAHRDRAAGLFHPDPENPCRALYVSRGVGHFVKFRLFCPPEVTAITLLNPTLA